MTDTCIVTVGDLIAALTAYNPANPVRIATQSGCLRTRHRPPEPPNP